MTSTRMLRAVLDARAAGLSEPAVAALADHLHDRPGDADRAITLALDVQNLGGGTPLLQALLASHVTRDQFLHVAARNCNPVWRLPPTGVQAVRTELLNAGARPVFVPR